MFTHLPKSSQVLLRIALSGAWFFSMLAGLSAVVFLSPVNDAGFLFEARVVAGISLTVATAFATVGVAFNRYRMEWVSSWFAAAGFTPYITLYWSVVPDNIDGTLPVAFLMMSLVTFYAFRGVSGGAHAARLREIHKKAETGPIIQLEKEVNDDE